MQHTAQHSTSTLIICSINPSTNCSFMFDQIRQVQVHS